MGIYSITLTSVSHSPCCSTWGSISKHKSQLQLFKKKFSCIEAERFSKFSFGQRNAWFPWLLVMGHVKYSQHRGHEGLSLPNSCIPTRFLTPMSYNIATYAQPVILISKSEADLQPWPGCPEFTVEPRPSLEDSVYEFPSNAIHMGVQAGQSSFQTHAVFLIVLQSCCVGTLFIIIIMLK